MADSVRVEQPTGRPVGGSVNAGRLHKGHGKIAASASIPSKYQTIVTDNSERKGFLSRSRRFGDGYGANPGPGRYNQPRPTETESSSFSKKGTGGFASKAKRFPRKSIQGESGPGPGEYEQPLTRENYFNRSGVTSNFHLPIAVKRTEPDKKDTVPAPNQYNIGRTTGKVAHDNNVAACAAFRSRSKRNWAAPHVGPSPCHYNISDRLVSDAPKIATAPFKSTTERKMTNSPLPIPGPGTYRPYGEEKLRRRDPRGFLNKHYLCISAPAMPLPLPDPLPGPGHYNVVDYEGPSKHFMSSSVFVSATSRWQGDNQTLPEEDVPGPATYRPQQAGKQSFIYNANARWVPG